MKAIITLYVSAIFFMMAASCTEGDSFVPGNSSGGSNNNGEEWLLENTNYLADGGVGKDGIPALKNPEFVHPSQVSYLSPTDLVIAVNTGEEVKVYPHDILDWHEIVNENHADTSYSVTYCPLTGTGTVWDDLVSGATSTFGVSGLLYNSNLIPYDRLTNSNWSQMKLMCVNGPKAGENARVIASIETNWSTVLEYYPEAVVISGSTGYDRDYGDYPYISGGRDYRTDDFLIFPVSHTDVTLHNKERVYLIPGGDVPRAFRFSNFTEGTKTINTTVGGLPAVVVGNQDRNYITAFYAGEIDGEVPVFSATESPKGIFEDQSGNVYDLFGTAVEGPDLGRQLKFVPGYMGYWFAVYAFFPNLELQ